MPALKPATIGQKFLTDCGQNRPLTTFKRHMLGENYNKVNHKNYYSNNYTWQADNAEGLFRIYGRDGELLSTIGYADLLNIDEDVLISEYGFNDELFRTLSYVREE